MLRRGTRRVATKEKLNERPADLEEEVDDQSTDQSESAEDSARAAAQAYYAAAAAGDYSYTYNELSLLSRSQFTEDEWVAANTELGSDMASYSVESVNMLDDSIAEVSLIVNLPDGSYSERYTAFVLENGSWKHDLTQEEYDLFAGAGGTASASASATATAQPEESDGEAPGDEQYESFAPVPESDNRDRNRHESGLGNPTSYPPVSEDDCPADAPIKGNQSGIYHEPDGAYYDVTDPEECFATPADAKAAGYRPSKR